MRALKDSLPALSGEVEESECAPSMGAVESIPATVAGFCPREWYGTRERRCGYLESKQSMG